MNSALVVGAGFAGLSAALELARAGVAVTVCEAADRPGGRAQLHRSPDGRFAFDMGPTIITMRETLARSLGDEALRELQLSRLEPGYRVTWSDGEHFDMHSDIALWLAEIERFRRDGSADALAYLASAYEMSSAAVQAILENPWTGRSWTRLFTAKPRPKVSAFGSLQKIATRAFVHPKLVDAATFQTLYLGLTPPRAPAAYALLMAQEVAGGVWYARGGTAAIVRTLARACEELGVRFEYGARATSVATRAGRARSIETTRGRFAADAYVLACDRHPALRSLLNHPAREPRYGHSAVVYYLGIRGTLHLPHHCVLLPNDTAKLYDDLDSGRVPSTPAMYLCHPAATDDSASSGALTVLVPVPNRKRADVDHDAMFAQVLATLKARFAISQDEVIYRHVRGPAQFESELGLAYGAAFGPSHDLLQMGPLRPSIDCPDLRNVVFAGSGTRPGSGVPLVLISGRLAARRLLERA